MNEIARILIFVGLTLVIFGLILALFGRIPGFGRLPGDILIKKENFTFYFPLVTSLLISVVLSFIFYLWNRK